MVTYWNRLKPLMDEKGIGKQGLADAIGVSFQAIAKIERGGSFGSDNNFKVANYFEVSPLWLATGRGERFEKNEQKRNAPPSLMTKTDVKVTSNKAFKIPLLPWEALANLETAMDMRVRGQYESFGTQTQPTERTFALVVTGDAMEPRIREGSTITVEGDQEPVPGNFVVAVVNGNAIFRQYVEDGSMKYLKPINERYAITPLNEGDKIIGVVTSFEYQESL